MESLSAVLPEGAFLLSGGDFTFIHILDKIYIDI